MIPFAQSIELPPPRPTSRSGRNARATAVPASISAAEGFSVNAEKTSVATPAARSASMPAAVWPQATMPVSLATSARVAPNSRAMAPSRSMEPGPTTSRVAAVKPNVRGSKGVTETFTPPPPAPAGPATDRGSR